MHAIKMYGRYNRNGRIRIQSDGSGRHAFAVLLSHMRVFSASAISLIFISLFVSALPVTTTSSSHGILSVMHVSPAKLDFVPEKCATRPQSLPTLVYVEFLSCRS
mgnify:CR=1 FL=1